MFGIWKPLGQKECSSNFPLDWTLFIKESGNDARKQMVHWFSFHCGKNKEKRSTLEDIPFFRKMSSGTACSVGFSPEKKKSFSLQMQAYRLKVRKKSEGYSAQATTVLKSDLLFSFFEIFHCGQWSTLKSKSRVFRIKVIEVIISVSCDHMSLSLKIMQRCSMYQLKYAI